MKRSIRSKLFAAGAILALAFIFVTFAVACFVGAAEVFQAVLRP